MRKGTYYLIRLDDACSTMNKHKWNRVEQILDKYKINPLVGVIPCNGDVSLQIDEEDNFFWDKVRLWQKKGWSIALHGFDHVYLTRNGGINPVYNRSEFAGLSLEEQECKIERGISILKNKNINVKYFFAPSHTFDYNTLVALKNKSNIKGISDTIARYPYKKNGISFYPQQFGRFRNIKYSGYWTFCFHPNNFEDKYFFEFENFISLHRNKFITFNEIDEGILKEKSLFDTILSFGYFLYRRIRVLF